MSSGLQDYVIGKMMQKTFKNDEKYINKEVSPSKHITDAHIDTIKNKMINSCEDNDLDYSVGSDFWKNAIKKNNDTETIVCSPELNVSSTRIKSIPVGITRSPSNNSVAIMLKNLKNTCETMESGSEARQSQHTIVDEQSLPTNNSILELKSKLNDLEICIKSNAIGINSLVNKAQHQQTTENSIQTLKQDLLSKITDLNDEIKNLHDIIKKNASVPTPEKVVQNERRDTWSDEIQSIKNDTKELIELFKLISPAKEPNRLDRPTKNMIINLNDKLIHLAKMQEHSFESINYKISQIEKKSAIIPETVNILHTLNRIEQRLDTLERDKTEENKKIETMLQFLKKRQIDSDSDSDNGESNHFSEIKHSLKTLQNDFHSETQITHDRMNQFMNIFSILQDAHVKLLKDDKVVNGPENKVADVFGSEKNFKMILKETNKVLGVAETINATLTRYLPLNLETKLYSIERLLKDQVTK